MTFGPIKSSYFVQNPFSLYISALATKISPLLYQGVFGSCKGIDTRTIQDYLGHANIQNTVRYTQLSAARFEGLWN